MLSGSMDYYYYYCHYVERLVGRLVDAGDQGRNKHLVGPTHFTMPGALSTSVSCLPVNAALQVIGASLSRQCKCHGVSGSCSMRTCFRSLPFDLRPVAEQLRSRYAVAVHVDPRSAAAARRRAPATTGRDRRQRRRHAHSPGGHNSAGTGHTTWALQVKGRP